MLLVSFYVTLAPSSRIFVYLALYALNLQCHLQTASQYEREEQGSFLLGSSHLSVQSDSDGSRHLDVISRCR